MISWSVLLDISAALLLLGLFLAGAYEAIAIINLYIPFTGNLPLITDIVRPWIAAHKVIALILAALFFAAFFWLFYHFYLQR
jgi:hypothetical protein